MLTLDEVYERLEGTRRRGDSFMARCPAHEDDTASLSVTRGNNGRILFKCFAGCSFESIRDAAGFKPEDVSPAKVNGKPEIVAVYDYRDEQEKLLYQVVRKTDGVNKKFSQRRPDGHSGYIWNLGDVRRVLYRLPELIKSQGRVWIVEGEKDVDKLTSLGLVATCNLMGAGKWRKEYAKYLKDREVVIVPDNDKSGHEHASVIADSLQGVAASIKILELPVPAKGDVSDYLATHTKEDLILLANNADTTKPDEPFGLSRMPCPELITGDFGVNYLIDGVLVEGQPCLIAGGLKTLKTSIALDLAISLATGGHFLGYFPVAEARRVGMLSGESGLSTLAETCKRIIDKAGCQPPSGLVFSTTLPKFGDPAHMDALRRFVEEDELEIIIIDPAYLSIPIATDKANNMFAMGEQLRIANDLFAEMGCTFALVHHFPPTKTRLEPPSLTDVAWSGFSEWARQWLLIARREKYNPDSNGEHALWLSAGGSAGHSGLWGLDVTEGRRSDPLGRIWDVEIRSGSQCLAEQTPKKQAEAQQQRERQFQADCDLVKRKMEAAQDHTMTEADIRSKCRFGHEKTKRVIAYLEEQSEIASCSVQKPNRRTPYPAWKLVNQDNGEHLF